MEAQGYVSRRSGLVHQRTVTQGFLLANYVLHACSDNIVHNKSASGLDVHMELFSAEQACVYQFVASSVRLIHPPEFLAESLLWVSIAIPRTIFVPRCALHVSSLWLNVGLFVVGLSRAPAVCHVKKGAHRVELSVD